MGETEGSLGSNLVANIRGNGRGTVPLSDPFALQSERAQATRNGGLLMLFLVSQQRSNNEVLYEAFELVIWSSTHVRHTIRRVGADCRNCDAACAPRAGALSTNHPPPPFFHTHAPNSFILESLFSGRLSFPLAGVAGARTGSSTAMSGLQHD
jgi:hypothetical protein